MVVVKKGRTLITMTFFRNHQTEQFVCFPQEAETNVPTLTQYLQNVFQLHHLFSELISLNSDCVRVFFLSL